jgi:hypothetical protein
MCDDLEQLSGDDAVCDDFAQLFRNDATNSTWDNWNLAMTKSARCVVDLLTHHVGLQAEASGHRSIKALLVGYMSTLQFSS